MGKARTRRPPQAQASQSSSTSSFSLTSWTSLALLGGVYSVTMGAGYLYASSKPATAEQSTPTQQQEELSASTKAALKEAQVGLERTPLQAEAADISAFRDRALPELHSFIFSNYRAYASSKLTFRDMKEHLASELGVAYELLRTDEYSAIVEDAVDAVTNECQGGKISMEECAAKFGLDPVEYS